ncbi:acyl-CoA dehydrogenase family protein [Niabella ginsengisoli]|uniref:Acyl-CoA dehydrogenase family protein n=1 Tax=Niabella ginsengisoli TaxID=522298 RepID=A0ABS9SPP8_9BACT|nr:acyl-CoA dehydrogenase family protein [Niabella ginsengisoli]MCH5600373.1 acyl-CoA dehydrogenase family protein [Niabella ginsengisoli]
MNTAAETNKTIKGAEWLIKESQSSETFTSEGFGEEELMIRDMCTQFVNAEVWPKLDRIDSLEEGLMKSLVQKAGEQGLLAAAFPEEYGGLGKDFITSTIINEYLGGAHSFSVAVAAHTGIGTLPILYFGTEAQKQKYIPKLVSGEWAGAYGLTEPNAGSDALSAKTTAKLSEDGKHYILNGQKCWITNGDLHRCTRYLQKLTAISLQALLLSGEWKGLPTDLKNRKWGLKDHQLFSYIFRMRKSRLKMCWAKLARDIRLLSIY